MLQDKDKLTVICATRLSAAEYDKLAKLATMRNVTNSRLIRLFVCDRIEQQNAPLDEDARLSNE